MIINQNANKNEQSGKERNRPVETQASQSFLLGHGKVDESKTFILPDNVYIVFYSPLSFGISGSYKHLISNEIRDYGDKKFIFEEFRNSLNSKLVLGGKIGDQLITTPYLEGNKSINLITLSKPNSKINDHILYDLTINEVHDDYNQQYNTLIKNFSKSGKVQYTFRDSHEDEKSSKYLSTLCLEAPKNKVTVYHWLACRAILDTKAELISYSPLSVTKYLENKQELVAKYQENDKKLVAKYLGKQKFFAKYLENRDKLFAKYLKNQQPPVIEYLERQYKFVTEQLKCNQTPDQLKRKRTPDQPKVMENYTQNNSSNKMPRMR
ncbi:putative adhesin [Cysteiniphilum sp. 6C5]|uniref:putative adhesin n=1 Tax=unclassified Cysteiniphilum TaxID=2610889 RepID=UPI003F86F458